jgi:radical SAM superfamily enzyme YgiQ (UPF0313 family)
MKRLGLVFPRFRYPSGDPPLGVAYLAAAVREWTDWSVEVIDSTFMGDPADETARRIEAGQYDAVGISFMTTMIQGAHLAAAAAKAVRKDTLVIAGGPHPTVAPGHVLKDEHFDLVVRGEGERTLAELLANEADPRSVPGVIYREGDKIRENDPQPPIEDLDTLPRPALDLLDMEAYFRSWFLLDSVDTNLKGTSIIASRGCPYRCTYCQPTLEALFGRRLRKRSPTSIIEELAALKDQYGINAFALQDDTFLIDKKWVLDVCSAIEKADLPMLWECNIRANLVDEEVFLAMKAAGLRKVNLGIESANQRILDEVFDKGITWAQVEEAVKLCRRVGLKMQGYFMLGAPTETFQEVMNTIRTAARLDLDDATFSITTPLPHTFLYDETRALIDREFEDFDYYATSVYKPGTTLSPRSLFWLKRWAFVWFYLGPKRIFKTLSMVLNPFQLSKTFAKLKRL